MSIRFPLWPGSQPRRGAHPPLFGPPFETTPSGRIAIVRALEGVPHDGEVWITSSLDTPLRRIPGCVTWAVGQQAVPSGRPSERTVGVVLVHEWGFPHPQRDLILREARMRGWRAIDDCAHAFILGLILARSGATVVFSLPKFFPIAQGGLLVRPPIREYPSAANNTDTLGQWLPASGTAAEIARRQERQVRNWYRLDALARRSGLRSVDQIDQGGIVPAVYRLAAARQFAARRIATQYGIETTPPFYTGWIALPCHADLPPAYFAAAEHVFEAISALAAVAGNPSGSRDDQSCSSSSAADALAWPSASPSDDGTGPTDSHTTAYTVRNASASAT